MNFSELGELYLGLGRIMLRCEPGDPLYTFAASVRDSINNRKLEYLALQRPMGFIVLNVSPNQSVTVTLNGTQPSSL